MRGHIIQGKNTLQMAWPRAAVATDAGYLLISRTRAVSFPVTHYIIYIYPGMYFTTDKLGQFNLEGAAVGKFMGRDPKDRQGEE